jgi:hypothetical protein
MDVNDLDDIGALIPTPPCDDIVGKFCNDRFVEVSIDEVLTHERAGDMCYVFAY